LGRLWMLVDHIVAKGHIGMRNLDLQTPIGALISA
jgi:hypothetical protein